MAWGIGWTFIKAPKNLKNCTLIGCFLPNVSVWKFQRNYVPWYWKVLQNLKENWLVTWKMTLGIWLTFMRAVESLEICTLIGSFCPQSIQRFRWKSTEELCLMTLKSDPKFEEKLTLGSKYDMRDLVNFHASSSKSEHLHVDVLLLSIAYKVSAIKEQNIYLSWHWKKIQTLKKNWLLNFKNWTWKMIQMQQQYKLNFSKYVF